MTESLAKHVEFSQFSLMLDKIIISKKKESVVLSYLQNLQKFRLEFIEKYGADCDSSLYPVLRLLVPNADRERDAYGIKGKTLTSLYIRILGINPNSETAIKFSTYDPTTEGTTKRGADLGDKIFDLMKGRAKEKGEITVADVNQYLDAIAQHFQTNNRRLIDEELVKMIDGMTQTDQKWITRIILKKLNLGISQNKILTIYHPMAVEFFELYSNLSRVCKAIETDEIVTVDRNRAELFHPIKPMLCQRVNFKKVQELLKEKEFYVETKMDGERFHIHKDGDLWKYFSRNGIDYTSSFSSTLTPFLEKLFKIPVKSVILDGEMMVWDKDNQEYRVKSENLDGKNVKADDPRYRQCFVVYDILYLNGQAMITKPCGERIRLLDTLVKEHPGIFAKCKAEKIRDFKHLTECLNKAIDDKEEGIIIKESYSQYKPNERNGGWYKIKPDYIDNLVSDLDLCIVGGFYNDRRTYINCYLVAIVDKNRENEEDSKFIAVCRVGSGLSNQKWWQINNALKPHWNTVQLKKEGRSVVSIEPKNIEWGATHPDLWVEPKNSIVLEVKASELVQTSSLSSGYTLRFPRIIAVRSDKSCFDVCTKAEFAQLTSGNTKVQKMANRYVENTDLVDDGVKKKVKRQKISPVAMNIIDDEEIETIDRIAKGKDFCIMSTSKGMPSVKELEVMVQKHGGRIVKNAGSKTFVVIAGDINYQIKRVAETMRYNIAKVDWLLRALGGEAKREKLTPFTPNEMLLATEELQTEFMEKYDDYGDSFTEKIEDNEKLKIILDQMNFENYELTLNELIETEKEVMADDSKLFRSILAKFEPNGILNYLEEVEMKLIEIQFLANGGRIVNDCDIPTHIFIVKGIGFGLKHAEYAKVLKIDWIKACLDDDFLMPENKYECKI